jgi:hypothetical protein
VHQEHLFLRLGVVFRVRVIDVSDGLIGFRGQGGTERVQEFGEDRAGNLIGVSRELQCDSEQKCTRRTRSQLIGCNDLEHDIEDSLEQTPIYVKDFWQGDTLGTLGDLIDSLVQRPIHVPGRHGIYIELMVDLIEGDVGEGLDLFLKVEFWHLAVL